MPVEPGPRQLLGGRDLGAAVGPRRRGSFAALDLGALLRQAAALLLALALVLVVLPSFSGSTAHASGLRLYLHNWPTPPSGDTAGSANLPMNASAPTAGTLYKYNVDQFNGRSGRHVREGSVLGHNESSSGYMVNWVYQTPEKLELNGTATAGIWITQKDGCNLPGHFHVWLRAGGSLVASGEAVVPATGGSPPCPFGFVPISLSVSETVQAGAVLELKLTVDSADRDAAMVAYDTTAYPSYLDLPVTLATPTPEPPTPTPTPDPATPTPDPATPTPEPATPTPEPATPTPEPATPTPEPPTPTPTPEPPTPTPTPEPPTPPPPTATPTPTPEPPTPPPPTPTPTPTPEPPTPPPPTKPPTPTPIEPTPAPPPPPTWLPTDPPTPTPPPPTPTPTAPPTPTPTEPPTPTPTQPPPTPDPIPSFLPPISPHETMPPLGELETPPPPSFPPPPQPQSPTAPPRPGPLAPVTTPAPRPSVDEVPDGDEARDPSDETERDDEPHRQLVDLTGGGSIDPDAPSGAGGEDGSVAATIAKLARTAGEAVKTFAFPLSLTVLVLIFLLIQGEIDRRDPKLAFAPVDSSKDMVHFE